MKALVISADGSSVEREMGEPECGVDFCDVCGDCLACYDCPCSSWVIYDLKRRERLVEES